MITYTTIIHQAREELGLSLHEYAILDIIYQLQNNPDSEHKGWCYASKKYIGECIGISEQSVHGILNKLYKTDLLEKQEDTKHIRTTAKWYQNVVLMKDNINTKESLVTLKKVESNTKETLVKNTKETLVYNNIYNNNINNIERTISYLEEIPQEDIQYFTREFDLTERQLKNKAEELADYCRAKGRKYSNYKAFLRNAIRKDFKKRVINPYIHRKELPPEVRGINLDKMAEIKAKIGII